MRRPWKRRYKLGVRGRITRGPKAGSAMLVDVGGQADPYLLLVVISPDLDVPGHPQEEHHFVLHSDLIEQLPPAAVDWTGPKDDTTAARFR